MAENAAWQRCRFCSPEQSSPEHEQHKRWLRRGLREVRAPEGAEGVCWCSERGSGLRAPQPAAPLGRQVGEEACSRLRNAGWPQASGVFSKEVLTFVSLRVQQTCAFLLLGGVVGNEEELLCWGFLKNIRREEGAGRKIFLSLRKIQSHWLPPYLSQAARPPGQLSARFWAARAS